MFDRLKNFVAEFAGPSERRDFSSDDFRLAAVALLVHLAGADGRIDESERKRLRELIESRFGLDAETTTRLIELAEAQDRPSGRLLPFHPRPEQSPRSGRPPKDHHDDVGDRFRRQHCFRSRGKYRRAHCRSSRRFEPGPSAAAPSGRVGRGLGHGICWAVVTGDALGKDPLP